MLYAQIPFGYRQVEEISACRSVLSNCALEEADDLVGLSESLAATDIIAERGLTVAYRGDVIDMLEAGCAEVDVRDEAYGRRTFTSLTHFG